MEDKKLSIVEVILEKTGDGWMALFNSPIMLLVSFCIGLFASDEVKSFFACFFPVYAMLLFAFCEYRVLKTEKIKEIEEVEEMNNELMKIGRNCIVFLVMIIFGYHVASKIEISKISLPSIIGSIQSLPATIRSLPHWIWWVFVGVVVAEDIVYSALIDMCEDESGKWSKKCKAVKILIGVTLVLLIGYFVVRNFG